MKNGCEVLCCFVFIVACFLLVFGGLGFLFLCRDWSGSGG